MAKGNRKTQRWMRRQVEKTNMFEDPRPDDIIVLVMGPTGVGKSTFINTAVGRPAAAVGHGLQSCTSMVAPITVPYPADPSRRVVFVDTPGFDDTFVDDLAILERVATWLERSYHQKNKIAAILYLHEISQARMLGTSRKNFTMFTKLSGIDAARKVALVTTKWSAVKDAVGRAREEELCHVYWARMLKHGSHGVRFNDTYGSAWDVVISAVEGLPLEFVEIQRELVELQKCLPETDAGKALRGELKEFLELEKERAQALQERRTAEAAAKHEEIVKRISSIKTQIEELKIPFSMKISAFFSSIMGRK